MERGVVTTEQLRAMLAEIGISVGKKAVIAWLTTGRVKGAKVGGRWFIPAAEVERLVKPFRETQTDGV